MHVHELEKKNLSFGGHITLIKASMTNLIVRYQSLFKITATIKKTLNKIQWDVLCERKEKKKTNLG